MQQNSNKNKTKAFGYQPKEERGYQLIQNNSNNSNKNNTQQSNGNVAQNK